MKVYVLNNGWLECDPNWMVSFSTLATLQDKECKHRWTKIPVPRSLNMTMAEYSMI